MESEYKNWTQNQFDDKTKNFKSSKELYFFLLNVLNLITHQGWYYCFCNKYYKKKVKWKKLLAISNTHDIFRFRKRLIKQQVWRRISWQYHEKLLFHLQEIFDVDKTALDCFLDSEFQYKGRDWYRGKTWYVSLSEEIDYEEKLNWMRRKKRCWGSFKKINLY